MDKGKYSEEGIEEWREMLKSYLPLPPIVYNYSHNLASPSLEQNLTLEQKSYLRKNPKEN